MYYFSIELETNFYSINTNYTSIGFLNFNDFYINYGDEFSLFGLWANSLTKIINCTIEIDDTKVNQWFINCIICVGSLHLESNNFISTKKETVHYDKRITFGIGINRPHTIVIKNNKFENFTCGKADNWKNFYQPNFGSIQIYTSSNTEIIEPYSIEVIGNEMKNIACNNKAGMMSILNYADVKIEGNKFINGSSPYAGFLYVKSARNLEIIGNSFTHSSNQESGILIQKIDKVRFENNSYLENLPHINSYLAISISSVGILEILSTNLTLIPHFSLSHAGIMMDLIGNVTIDNFLINGTISNYEYGSAITFLKVDIIQISNLFIHESYSDESSSFYSDNSILIKIESMTIKSNFNYLIGIIDFNVLNFTNLNLLNNHNSKSKSPNIMLISQKLGNASFLKSNFSNNFCSNSIFFFIQSPSKIIFDNLYYFNNQAGFFEADLFYTSAYEIKNSYFSNVSSSESILISYFLDLKMENLTFYNIEIPSNGFILTNSILRLYNTSFISFQGVKIQNSFSLMPKSIFKLDKTTTVVNGISIKTIKSNNFIDISYSNVQLFNSSLKNSPGTIMQTFFKGRNLEISLININISYFTFQIFSIENSDLNFSISNIIKSNSNLPLISIVSCANVKFYDINFSDSFSTKHMFFYGSKSVFLKNIVANHIKFANYFIYSDEIQELNLTNITLTNGEFIFNKALTKTLFLFEHIKVLCIKTLIVENITLEASPLFYFYHSHWIYISNFSASNINFNGDKFSENLGLSLLVIIAFERYKTLNSINSANFSNISSPDSFPILFSNSQIKANNIENFNITGRVMNFYSLILGNIDFEVVSEKILAPGASNIIEIMNFQRIGPDKRKINFDNQTKMSISTLQSDFSIVGDNLNNALQGRFVFDQFSIRSLPNIEVTLQITLQIQSKLFYLSLSQNYQRSIHKSIVFKVRDCIIGEVYRISNRICYQCPKDSYSTFDSDNKLPLFCRPCPKNALCPGSSLIVPLSEYWKAPTNSTLIIKCPYKEVCINLNKTRSGCIKGHKGPLCLYCEPGYGKTSIFQCQKCDENISHLFLNSFYILVFCALASIFSALSMNKIKGDAEHVFSLVSVFISNYHYLSILFYNSSNYNQLEEITFKLTNVYQHFISIISLNTCIFSFLEDQSEVYLIGARLIMVYISFLFLLLVSLLLFVFFRIVFKRFRVFKILFKGTVKRFIFNLTLFIFNFNFPNLLAANLSLFNCLEIDNYLRKFALKFYPNVECYDKDHIFLLTVLGVPGFIIIGIIIPIILVILLFRYRKYLYIKDRKSRLKKISFTEKLDQLPLKSRVISASLKNNTDTKTKTDPRGRSFMKFSMFRNTKTIKEFNVEYDTTNFYSKGYKMKYCWWEFNKLLLKVIISIVISYEIKIPNSTLMIVLVLNFLIYFFFFVHIKPYEKKECNMLESLSLGFCILFVSFSNHNISLLYKDLLKRGFSILNGIFCGIFFILVIKLCLNLAMNNIDEFVNNVSDKLTILNDKRKKILKTKTETKIKIFQKKFTYYHN